MNFNWQDVLNKLQFDLTSLVADLIMIVIAFILAALFLKWLSKLTNRIIRKANQNKDDPRSKSIITLMTHVRSIGRYLTYFLAFCFAVNRLGYGNFLSNIVTAAGIGALAISLGAQSIISDIVAGAFILFEKQYNVGDFVKINEYSGTVTSLATRCTYLKSWTGEKIIIPNGQVKTVINYSGEFNMAQVVIATPYEADSEKVLNILKEVADEYYQQHQDICYDKPDVVGINSFDESSVSMAIYQKAKERNHFRIQRDLRLAVKKRFDKEGISIPYNQIVVHHED